MSSTIQLSPETTAILKNMNQYAKSLSALAGNKLNVIMDDKTVSVDAEIPEALPGPIYIADLSEFLGVLGLFGKTPSLTFQDDSVIVFNSANPKSTLTYRFCEPQLIERNKPSPENYKALQKKLENVNHSINITKSQLDDAIHASNLLGIDVISIVSDSSGVSLTVDDPERQRSNNLKTEITETQLSEKFKIDITQSKLKLYPGDYAVNIFVKQSKDSAIFITQFKNKSRPISYLIAANKTSTLG